MASAQAAAAVTLLEDPDELLADVVTAALEAEPPEPPELPAADVVVLDEPHAAMVTDAVAHAAEKSPPLADGAWHEPGVCLLVLASSLSLCLFPSGHPAACRVSVLLLSRRL